MREGVSQMLLFADYAGGVIKFLIFVDRVYWGRVGTTKSCRKMGVCSKFFTWNRYILHNYFRKNYNLVRIRLVCPTAIQILVNFLGPCRRLSLFIILGDDGKWCQVSLVSIPGINTSIKIGINTWNWYCDEVSKSINSWTGYWKVSIPGRGIE